MCEKPVFAWLDNYAVNPDTGKPRLLFKLPHSALSDYLLNGKLSDRYRGISLPCGKCFSCRRDRAWEITVRASFEARMYDFSSFITLTVSDDNLLKVFPVGVVHRPWQLFAKKLRKKIGPFRYLMCAEYGSQTARPHYHAIIFGHKFTDVVLNSDGSFCRSKIIQECWKFGQIQVDDVNDARIAYVAGYTLKDLQLGRDSEWYDSRFINKPYVRWSRVPGLGFTYFRKFFHSLIKHNVKKINDQEYDQFLTTLIFSGKQKIVNSRYFSEKLACLDPALYDTIQASKLTFPVLSTDELLSSLDKMLRRSACGQYLLSQKVREASHNMGIVNKERKETSYDQDQF